MAKPIPSTSIKSATPAKSTKSPKPTKSTTTAKTTKPTKVARTAAKPVLLSGGNPQIAKADGDAAVQAYITSMPGWKREVGRRLDEIISKSVPKARKAVRWNTPFYGIEDNGWFVGFHCITKYVKVALFNGASLSPLPPVKSSIKDVRYFHIYEGDEIDEALLASWMKQAAKLPGSDCF